MSPEMKLLRAFIDECGMDIQDLPGGGFKVTRRQKKKRTAKDIQYTDDFLAAWSMYPKRAGNNSKLAAFKAFNARIQEKEPFANIMHGVQRYLKFIESTDKLNTEYVLMASTFFGPQKHYLAEWLPPKKKYNKEERELRIQELRKNDWAIIPNTLNYNELCQFADEYGYKLPDPFKTLEEVSEYKKYLAEIIQARIEKEL